MRDLVVLAMLAACSHAPGPQGLAVEPASVEVVNGAIVTAQLQAVETFADGSTMPVDATWTLSDARLGAIDGSGVFTPTGELGGIAQVTAVADGLTATAPLLVKLHLIDGAPALDQPTRDAMHAAAASLPHQPGALDPAIAWTYPYDGTVFPRGLAAPIAMWNGGTTGDWYYIHFISPTYELETYSLVSPTINQVALSQFQIPELRWRQLTESTVGAVDLTIARWSNQLATGVIHHRWTIAPTTLPGTIYYWTMKTETGSNAGRMMALDLASGASVDFLGGFQPTGTEGCPKCHTPSADGRHMSLVMVDPTIGLLHPESVGVDLATGTASYAAYPTTGGWAAAALSAHGDILVQNFAGIRGTLGIGLTTGAFDAVAGTSIAGTGLDGIRTWMPSFASDDHLLVYVAETPTPGGCVFNTGQGATDGPLLKACSSDLHAIDWDPVQRQATNDRLLVAKGSDPTKDVLQYPVAAPDHRLVIYGRGPELGSFSDTDGTTGIAGSLYAAWSDTPGTEVPLDQLGGAIYPFAAGDRDRALDYDASFAPISAGGYDWVVFVSRRTYGNILTGAPFLGQDVGGVKQLWIAAIDPDAAPGTDPSHAAFWLPGQMFSPTDPTVINQRPRWALSPCDGDDCPQLP